MKLISLLFALCLPANAPLAEPFELKDGDRVVLVGSTLIEREQRYGYWEAALTRRWPDRNITFRNLGWSGDTVFGDARASFDSRVEGFKRLKEGVLSLKPTVIIIGYGTNESFEGGAGLPAFKKGLETLLDALSPAKARIVLLSPLQRENMIAPLPEPATQNKNLKLYTELIRNTAKKYGAIFVNMFDDVFQMHIFIMTIPSTGKREGINQSNVGNFYTDNGMHMTIAGYGFTGIQLEKSLGLPPWSSVIEVDLKNKKITPTKGLKIDRIGFAPLRFEATSAMLPYPTTDWKYDQHLVIINDLIPGKYTLFIDDKAINTFTASDMRTVISVNEGPEFDQSEKLREAIIAKNRLYFHRWRPQNETYLFGFRKNEQGKNAIEVPMFDPLVEKKEAEIAKLRVPVKHIYELKKVEAKP